MAKLTEEVHQDAQSSGDVYAGRETGGLRQMVWCARPEGKSLAAWCAKPEGLGGKYRDAARNCGRLGRLYEPYLLTGRQI